MDGEMGTLIKPNGEHIELQPQDTRHGFSLRELYSLIGCDCIDVVMLRDGLRMVCDDDAARKESEPNRSATLLYWASGGIPGWWIRGNVIVGNAREIQ